MLRKTVYLSLLIAAAAHWSPGPVTAQPASLRDDIEVRNVLTVPTRTMRLVKDPRDNTLYTMTVNGNISRVVFKDEGELTGETFARGVRNADGEWVWTTIATADGVPDGVPVDEIRAAAETFETRATDPVEDQLYILDTRNNRIITPPNNEVAVGADYGIAFPKAISFGADGSLYIVLDTDLANASGSEQIVSSADHGFNDTQGFAIGPDGTFYIGAITRDGGRVNNIARGVRDEASGTVTWSIIARTDPITPGSKNHPHPNIAVSPDGQYVFLSSGSRTDHGEMSGADREQPLSGAILRVPADGQDILIPGGRDELDASGYLFADGFRNAFDINFAGNGDMFAGDNGPDSDLPEGIMWVRQGHHFGFPWRMGGTDNPQRDPNYDPAVDNYILFTPSGARSDGLFHNDPDYPSPPMEFTDPIINFGPDADRYRDPESGEARDAGDEGGFVKTLTPHSSPLGLVFDVDNALADEFRGDGFVLRTGGDCCNLINSFNDPDEDLLHMDLEKVGDNYESRMSRIVEGFSGPIDAEIIGNKIYVIEWSGSRGLWEITLPGGAITAVEDDAPATPGESALDQNYPNPFNPNTTITYRVAVAGAVELAIYNAAGQKIRDLVAGHRNAGGYAVQWNGRDNGGQAVASGTYIYRLTVGDYQESRPLTLLK
ncbi:MAG: T9SS type A sorting domain-containing protein [Candidatus Latescibacteria bacterium]|nr:T9SS type A sorting domain-containing protein [Candidatus Latescibacterota bacterium]